MAAPRTQVYNGAGVWLLELDLGGRIARFGTEAATVEHADGSVDKYTEGLDVGTLPRSATSATLRIDANGSIDWAELVARGMDLGAVRGTLRRWFDGQVLEQAEVRFTGPISGAEWGAADEVFVCTLANEPWRDRTMIPSVEMTFDENTWPVTANYELDEPAYGQTYPVPIGRPGAASWDSFFNLFKSGTVIPACPAYLAEYSEGAHLVLSSKAVFAGMEVHATEAMLFDASDGICELVAVQTTTDLRGRRVSYVDFTTCTLVRAIRGHEYYVAFPPGQGGIYNRDRSGYLRGAGELICYLLGEGLSRIVDGARVKFPVDIGRQEAQRPYLDRFLVDGVINRATDVDAWIRGHLASMLPIEWVEGGGGGYWLAWRYDATAEDAVMHLDAGKRQVRRLTNLTAPETQYTAFRVEYGHGKDGVFWRRRLLTGATSSTDPRVRPSYVCELAQRRQRERLGGDGIVEWVHRSEMLQDDATADRIVEIRALQDALPPIPVAYEGGPELEALERGDVVTLTDPEVYLDGHVALVDDLVPGDRVVVNLKILTNPLLVDRRTS
jgi:hypothetical protein